MQDLHLVEVLQQELRNNESYNGTTWTELNDLNTARYALAGAGESNTAALAFGGLLLHPAVQALTENLEWNKLDRS
jgi:hypothetical protein